MTAAQLALFDLPAARPPVTWLEPDSEPVAFRACWRCEHGVDEHGARLCGHPELKRDEKPVTLLVARGWGGGCGPDADKLNDPGIAP